MSDRPRQFSKDEAMTAFNGVETERLTETARQIISGEHKAGPVYAALINDLTVRTAIMKILQTNPAAISLIRSGMEDDFIRILMATIATTVAAMED